MSGFLARVLVGLAAVAMGVTPRSTIPMRSLAHLTVVDVTINGKGPYQMVLDTGAGVTVVHKDLANYLGVPKIGSVEIGGPMQGTPIIADLIRLEVIRIGDVDFRGLEAVALDLDEIFKPLTAPDGILSVMSLKGRLITLDFKERQVVMHSDPLLPADDIAILEYAADQPVPAIPVTIGGISVQADLDTGSPTLISMPLDYADKLSLEAPPKRSAQGRIMDATFEIVSSRLDGNLVLGQFTLENPIVAFHNRGSRVVLGTAFLKLFTITFDNDRRVVGFKGDKSELGTVETQLGGQRRTAVGERRYGIAFHEMTGDFLTVMRVDAGFPAENGGLKAGDRIVSMNGVAVEAMTVSERIEALRGSPLRVVVDRDGSTIELTLALD